MINEGYAVDITYCDFMRAFDKVPHGRLKEKLSYNIKVAVL